MNLQVRNLQALEVDKTPLQRIAGYILAVRNREDVGLSLVFVDDARMQEINRAYRGLDRPTDVISFEAEPDAEGGCVGEIIISIPTAGRQAAAAGHSVETEIGWLFAHGVLHVLGDDDDTDEHLEQMKRQQREALAAVGIVVAETANAA